MAAVLCCFEVYANELEHAAGEEENRRKLEEDL
jgi:hypothetical protein